MAKSSVRQRGTSAEFHSFREIPVRNTLIEFFYALKSAESTKGIKILIQKKQKL